MGRIYTVPGQGTVTTAGGDNDLFIFLPADDKPIKLRGWVFGQTSEVKDTEEEGLRISIYRMTATVTDGNGSAVTPVPVKRGSSASGFTSEFNGTTVATTSGTSTIVAEVAWINRVTPWEFWFPDDDFCPDCIQGEALVIRLQTTLADDMTFVGTVFVEEMG